MTDLIITTLSLLALGGAWIVYLLIRGARIVDRQLSHHHGDWETYRRDLK